MKRNIVRILVFALCMGLLATSLSGCFYWGAGHALGEAGREIGRAAGEVGREIGNAAGEAGREIRDEFRDEFNAWGREWDEQHDDWDDDINDWADDLANNITDNVMDSLPSIETMLESNRNASENRTANSYDDVAVDKVRIAVNNASNVIIRQEAGDSLVSEYDPAHFSVQITTEGDTLTIQVKQIDRPRSGLKNYQAFLSLPDRVYDEIFVDAKDAGVTLLRLASPVRMNAKDSGIALGSCAGSMKLSIKDSGVSLEIPQSFDQQLTLDGQDLGLSVAFLGGEPDNLDFVCNSSDSAAAVRLGEKTRTGSEISYQIGDSSVAVHFDLDDSAISVGIKP